MTLRKLDHAAFVFAPAIAVILLVPGSAHAADQSIGDFEAAQQTAWNAHDAAAYAAAFDADAQVITSLGWRWSSQAEAARNLADGFKLVYAGARLRTSDMKVRTLSSDLASVTQRWTIEGARTIEGGAQAGEQQGYQTQVLQRRGEGWAILAQQDTLAASSSLLPGAAAQPSPAGASENPQAFPTTPPPVRRCILARGNGECLIYGKAKPAPTN